MENVSINLELSLEEVNMILDTLGKHPFAVVVELIGKVRTQGEEQLEAYRASEENQENKEY
jgi:hypothetical protein